MPRVYSYYGNNRLQQQANARNIYGNNMNGKRLINNRQTSNYNSSNFNTYNVGAQTEYVKGTGSDIVTGQRYVVSVGGIADIPATIPLPPPPPPPPPHQITLDDIATPNANRTFWTLQPNKSILLSETLTINRNENLYNPHLTLVPFL